MSAKDLPNTPEVRKTLAEMNDISRKQFGVKDGPIELWEDGYRAVDDPANIFEWWYFDMHFDDGSTLVVTFANKPPTEPYGPVAPLVLVLRQAADGTSSRETYPVSEAEFSAATDRPDVKIGPNTVSGDLETYVMHLEIDGEVIDATIKRTAPSWRSGSGVSYSDSARKHFFGWVVGIPSGTVEATFTKDGETVTRTGTAYHDHNWGNRLMHDVTDYWFWGRAIVGPYTLVYARTTTRGFMGMGQLNVPTIYLATKDRIITEENLPVHLETSGEVEAPGGHTYPEKLEWTWETERGRIAWTVTNPRLIESIDMTVPRHGIARLLHAGEHPKYYDFNGDITLEIDLDDLQDTQTGHTLYEKMIFH